MSRQGLPGEVDLVMSVGEREREDCLFLPVLPDGLDRDLAEEVISVKPRCRIYKFKDILDFEICDFLVC